MGFRKGTGFTNLNKVMTANRGNKLGSAVAGGISTQNQGINTGIQTAQQKFQEEAQKNRLDTEENKQKRDETIGRFNQPGVDPDMSGFQVSSGLQSQFTKDKEAAEQNRTAAQQSAQASQNAFNAQQKQYEQSKLAYDNAVAASTAFKAKNPKYSSKSITGNVNTTRAAYDNSFAQNQQLNTANMAKQSELANIEKTIADLEANFGRMTESEKDNYRKSEIQKSTDANALTDQNVSDFAKFRAGNYAGPQELRDAGALYSKAQQAEQSGELSRTSGGRQELLKRFVGQGDYSQGQRQLDETLLGQDSNALRSAARQTAGAAGRATEANQQARGLAQELSGRARIFGDETGQKLQDVRSPYSEQLDTRVAEAQAKEDARSKFIQGIGRNLNTNAMQRNDEDSAKYFNSTMDEALQRGDISQQELDELRGGDQNLVSRGKALGFNVPTSVLQNMKDVQAQNINRAGIASDEEIARLNALDRLSGKQGMDLEFRGQDKYAAGNVGLNLNPLRQDIYTKEASADTQALADTQAKINHYLASSKNEAKYRTQGHQEFTNREAQATKQAASKKLLDDFMRKQQNEQDAEIRASDENLKKNVDYDPKDVQSFMDRLKPASYDYKDEVKNDPRASKDRQLGVMAQDLEKSKLGKEAVHEADIGKVVDYKDLEPKMLASLAALNQRLKKIEGGGHE